MNPPSPDRKAGSETVGPLAEFDVWRRGATYVMTEAPPPEPEPEPESEEEFIGFRAW